jgi:DNA sulfur modification protein DndB
MKTIHLPCLRGSFGEWTYFSTVMKIKDVVEYNRIITVPESQELYSKKLNEILQREYDKKRIERIKNYILTMPERFFSSLVVAIHKGDPIWSDFDLETHFKVENEILDDENFEFIENKLGVLTLSGSEEIFVLDGQHRLLGLRSAYEADKKIGNDEIALIFVVHSEKLKERTRRLFTVLNRYAVKIKPAEQVILEEDDAAAILTRRLVETYDIFKHQNALSTTAKSGNKDLNKGFSLPSSDLTSFTTLVCLYQISMVIINHKELYKGGVIKRPSDDILDILWGEIKMFWDDFLALYPEVVSFIKGEITTNDFKRNPLSGGSLLLRPEGQLLFAEIYKTYKTDNRLNYFRKHIKKVDFNLSGPVWNYIFWKNPGIETTHKRLKKSVLMYILGDLTKANEVRRDLIKIYGDHNLVYDEHIKPITQ